MTVEGFLYAVSTMVRWEPTKQAGAIQVIDDLEVLSSVDGWGKNNPEGNHDKFCTTEIKEAPGFWTEFVDEVNKCVLSRHVTKTLKWTDLSYMADAMKIRQSIPMRRFTCVSWPEVEIVIGEALLRKNVQCACAQRARVIIHVIRALITARTHAAPLATCNDQTHSEIPHDVQAPLRARTTKPMKTGSQNSKIV